MARRRTLYLLLVLGRLSSAAIVPGCSGTEVNQGATTGSAGCVGDNPFCFGPGCCNPDPSGPASCKGGKWMCGDVAAPGCGSSCNRGGTGGGGAGGGGTGGGGTGGSGTGGMVSLSCVGAPPLCRGQDPAACCEQDPAGFATCSGGEWLCFGTIPAPGCNGQSCFLGIGGGAGAGGTIAGAGGQAGAGP
jgi:hypothetical protein